MWFQFPEQVTNVPQIFSVADQRIVESSYRYIEYFLLIDPVQTVVTGLVQRNESGCTFDIIC